MTLVLYREKRRWKFDVADGDGYESVLFGADNILDRLARLAETLTLDVSAIETRADGEIALVAVEGSDLRGWRLFRRREGEEFGFLSPAVLELLGLPDVLFLNRAGSDA